MIIVDVRESESLDRALKKFKKRVERAKVLHELRERQHFVKLSVKRRATVLKAVYIQKMFGEEL